MKRLWLVASGAEKLCALGAKGWRLCAAPQLHRYAALNRPGFSGDSRV